MYKIKINNLMIIQHNHLLVHHFARFDQSLGFQFKHFGSIRIFLF